MYAGIKCENLLLKGLNYREMRVRESAGKWRFQLVGGDITYTYVRRLYPGNHEISFRDMRGTEWMRLGPYRKIIRHGYTWNGNSPKKGVRLLGKDIWLGTPDYRRTLEASLSHDADYQFCQCEKFPTTRELVDWDYYTLLKNNDFKGAGVFYSILRRFSERVWDGKSSSKVKVVIM